MPRRLAPTLALCLGLALPAAAGQPPRFADGEVPAAPENGGPRLFEVATDGGSLALRAAPSAGSDAVGHYAPGTLLTNFGCETAEGRTWCDVQELGGGPVGYVAATFLRPALSPDGSVATGPDDSAIRAGRGAYDATGQLPCAGAEGQPTRPCDFGVARAGGGFATVVVTLPDGTTRPIWFANGRAIGAGSSQADGSAGWDFSATRQGDLTLVSFGPQRFEIPDAVILGG